VQQFVDSIFTAVSHYSVLAYAVVFGVAFLESFAFIGLVVPGAVFAVSAGFFASRGMLSLSALIISGAVGAILADLASFYLASRYGDKVTAAKFYPKYQPYMEKGRRFFERHGGKSVFFGRFIGLIRPVIPFLAGLLKMNAVRFWVYAIASGVLWAIAYIGAGYLFGKSWKVVEAWTGKFSIFLLVLFAAAYLVKKLLKYIAAALRRFYPLAVLLYPLQGLREPQTLFPGRWQ
jgi:membrane protein DedA with SNARE-associated domain